jgi:2-dehydro-3-deoxygalactonokinase
MRSASLVAGDWGTSHLRLFLCDADGAVLERRTGPGAAEARNRFDEVFEALAGDWIRAQPDLPVILCGMVGSNFGWIEAPYVPCPARADQIAAQARRIGHRNIQIVPGLRCRNRFDAPDRLRGEETQILGVLPVLQAGTHVLCMPGTHTKWVLIEGGGIREFFTAATGEVFSLIKRHSVLVPQDESESLDEAAFAEAVAQVNRFPHAQWLHRVFECRSRRLAGELADGATAGFLSGLTIGSDVAGALPWLTESGSSGPIHVIGDQRLTSLYAKTLASHQRPTQTHDGEAAALAGLIHLKRLLHG